MDKNNIKINKTIRIPQELLITADSRYEDVNRERELRKRGEIYGGLAFNLI